jgi:tripartite-type tricarboxylate transporter receptor subunit TctC
MMSVSNRMGLVAASLAALACGAGLSSVARAQAYPSRPVTIIVTPPAGSTTDVAVRHYGARFQALTGQPLIVTNRTGAGGNIGAKAFVGSKPDGYTLFIGSVGTQAANVYLYKDPGFDPEKDMTPVTSLFRLGLVMAVNEQRVPVKSLAELTAFLRARKEPIFYGYAVTSMHVAGEMYRRLIGIEATPVGYPGVPQQMTALSRGEYDFTIADAAFAAQPVPNQRSLAVTLERRSAVLPDLPTMAEAGLPEFKPLFAWFALYLPANAPRPIVDRLTGVFNRITAMPETAQVLKNFAGEPYPSSPEALAAFQAEERRRWGELIKEAKIEPQ